MRTGSHEILCITATNQAKDDASVHAVGLVHDIEDDVVVGLEEAGDVLPPWYTVNTSVGWSKAPGGLHVWKLTEEHELWIPWSKIIELTLWCR